MWELGGEEIHLLKEKAVLLPNHDALLLSDLHLGKTQHFRKNGLALPAQAGQADIENLHQLLTRQSAKNVFFLGDLFHSEQNTELDAFYSLLETFPDKNFTLIPGNHDVLPPIRSLKQLAISENKMPLGNLVLCHEPEDLIKEEFGICGHIHPGYRLKGKGRQNIMLPAFFLYANMLLLPAFGALTGLVKAPQKGLKEIGVITPESVHLMEHRA